MYITFNGKFELNYEYWKASKLSELTVKAVRYYDNIGLVKPHQNTSSGYRGITKKMLKLKFVVKHENSILV